MLELVITEGMLFVVVILLLCVDYGVAHIAFTLCVCPCNVTGSCASKLAPCTVHVRMQCNGN